MNDVTIRLKLQEDVNTKLTKITTTARNAASQVQMAGRQIDNAFRTSAPEQFATRLGNAIRGAATETNSLAAAMGRVATGVGSAAGLSEPFEEAADNTQELTETLADAAESVQDFAESAEGAGESIDDLVEAAEHLGEGLGAAGEHGEEVLGNLPEEAQGAGQAMGDAGGKAFDLAGALKSLFAVVAGAMVLGKIKDFASDSIELGKGYTSMMSEVQAISGASAAEMEQLEATAREYGATTVFSASEAAEALKYMSLAGWDANQSASALGGVLNLAAASGMGLGQASDMVTDYLSAFGMEASQASYFADMLAFAQSNSNTTAEALGEAYRNSAANMHAAGQDVETTTSLLEAMANQGYKGSEAGTALAAVMRDITQKMDEGVIKIGETAIAVQDSEGNFRDLTDILTDVESATDGMGDAQKAAALGTTFTADSIKAMNMILTEGMSTISGYEEELRNAGGTAENMAGIMNDNLSGDMANMNSAFEEMQLQVFEQMEGPLRDGAQYITDTVIPILTDWVPDAFGALAEGAAKLGNALKPLFETILKNPQAIAGAFSSLGAGFVALKGVSGAMSVGKKISAGIAEAGSLGGALSKLASSVFGNPWAAGAAAVAAAVTAIGVAIHYYNQMQINDSLETHFGDIELDDSQIEDFAGHVLKADWMVNINAALGHFENADQLLQQAQEALASNDTLEWKTRVGMALDETDKETFLANIETFTQSSLDELSERSYAAEISVTTMLGSNFGGNLANSISKWAAEDMAEVETIKKQLTNLVEMALEDGIIDVDEQAAIDILQGKINSILSGWKSSEAQAEMDLITQQYGRLSGKDLTSGTFTSIIEALQEQRETAAEALEADAKQVYSVINGLMESGRLTQSQGDGYKERFAQVARNEEAFSLANSLGFEADTLSDTYGEKLKQNREGIKEETDNFLEEVNHYFDECSNDNLERKLQNAYKNSTNISGADQKALSKLYENMKPDTTAMESMIDEYVKEGQKVPKAVAEAFNESIQIGAAAGDADAGWAVFAQQMLADPASKALVDAIQDGTVDVPEELTSALERAVATSAENVTNDPVKLEDLDVELQNLAVNADRVRELLTKAMEGINATGEIITLENEMVAVEFEVTAPGQSLEDIAAQVGITIDELLVANPNIENPNEIQVGQKIYIPADKVEVDASGVGEAANQTHEEAQKQADEATSEPVQAEQEVRTHIKHEVVSEDKSALQQANEMEETETVEKNVSVEYQVSDISIDDSRLTSAVQEAIDGCTANLSYESVTSAVGNGIASAIQATIGTIQEAVSSLYHKVGDAINKAFAAGFHTSTNVTITANYKLANPTANINFSGGGTGTASVKASLHAEGGYFDQPHLGIVAEAGGEYIIPMDGSERSKSMWMDAGQMLGIENRQAAWNPINTMQASGKASTESISGEKTINLNINGNGSLQVTGKGVSKEQVVEVMFENVKEALMSIIRQEIMEEGDLQYEF